MTSRRTLLGTSMGLVAAMLVAGLPADPAGASVCASRVVVTDPGDDGGSGQLRAAVVLVCDGGTIGLRVAEPIVLTDGPLHVDKAVRVIGGGATIDAPGGAFTVAATGALRLGELTLANSSLGAATGILVMGGAVTLDDVTVTQFTRSGIRMRAPGSALVLNGASAVTGNVVPADTPPNTFGPVGGVEGAGIHSWLGSVTLNDTATVSENIVHAHSPGNIPGTQIPVPPFANGGGIFNVGGMVTLHDDASITGNAAVGSGAVGGGIYNWSERSDGVWYVPRVLVTDNASVTGNTAWRAGGIMNRAGEVVLRDAATVAGNTAGQAGGGIYGWRIGSDYPASTVTLHDRATITANTAPSGAGGGVHNDGGALVILDDAAVSGNTATDVFGWTMLP
jgi:hypothetical protein